MSLNHEVVMIAHHAVGKRGRLEAIETLLEYLQPCVTIGVIFEDRLAPISARGHVVERTFELKP